MKPLSQVRNGWTAIEAEETRLLRELTIEESVRQYLALQREFEHQLQETEPIFRQHRNEAMIQLQARLSSLNDLNPVIMGNLITSLVLIQEKLERAGIPTIAIGGLAVGVWGEPRLTRDVDVKVLAGRDERARVLENLSDYIPLNADPDAAFRQNGIAFFQNRYGVRVDIMLAENIFDETAIGRAKTVELGPGNPVRVCSAEDLIIHKLVSLRRQDHLDVVGVIKRQGDVLDDDYVEKWLREFELALDDSTLVTEYRRLRGRTF